MHLLLAHDLSKFGAIETKQRRGGVDLNGFGGATGFKVKVHAGFLVNI